MRGNIPPRTARDLRRIPRLERKRAGYTVDSNGDWSFDLSKHVCRKPAQRPKARPQNPEITCTWDIIEAFNEREDLALILQFSGLWLSEPFTKTKGLEYCSYTAPVSWTNQTVILFLTTLSDTVEAKVQQDLQGALPLFKDTIRMENLSTTHDPMSMFVYHKNGIIVASYHRSSP